MSYFKILTLETRPCFYIFCAGPDLNFKLQKVVNSQQICVVLNSRFYWMCFQWRSSPSCVPVRLTAPSCCQPGEAGQVAGTPTADTVLFCWGDASRSDVSTKSAVFLDWCRIGSGGVPDFHLLRKPTVQTGNHNFPTACLQLHAKHDCS